MHPPSGIGICPAFAGWHYADFNKSVAKDVADIFASLSA